MQRAFRRIAPLVVVPVALSVMVRTTYAVSPETAARWHATADDIVGSLTNALSGMRLFVNPTSQASRAAGDARLSRPEDAAMLERIAQQPVATWIGGWVSDLRGEIGRITAVAQRNRSVPVLVAYNIPNRDCGSHSAGGEKDGESYGRWIREFAAGLDGRKAVVVLEPDAIAQTNCLTPEQTEARFAMMRDAVSVLKSGGATVYVDAGNPRWMKPDAIASRLKKVAMDQADGFSLNVSNFISTSENVKYGEAISGLVGGKHFIIDTGRNGSGGNGQWCNPRGQALGALPTTETGNRLVDGFLWIKQPGESDGACNGGPKAGAWWADYALELARNQKPASSRELAAR
ncbi:MAG: glycoside hydrolase family 6 protein [Gemmatimonadaceae bacterium]